VASVQLSDWYELVDGSELEQGDVFERCPVFRPPDEVPWPLPEEGADAEFTVETQDVVVMTQSCDLVSDQKTSMASTILCPLWSLSAVAEVNDYLNSSYGKEMCRRGNVAGYHMLAACDHDDWRREISIVGFREIHNLPISFLRRLAEERGPRPRIRSPYKEHLAQAFARYFMRVGLPVDIPRFHSPDDERRAIERLEALDEDARRRVIDVAQG
jgi:hypothetical protein